MFIVNTMCLHNLFILCFLIRAFNCLSRFSLKPQYTPKFKKSLKFKKSVEPEQTLHNLKIPKIGKNVELSPPPPPPPPKVEHESALLLPPISDIISLSPLLLYKHNPFKFALSLGPP